MTEASRERFAEVVRRDPVDLALACLLIGVEVDPTLDPAPSLARLDALAASVDPSMPPVDALRAVLAGFTGDAHDYEDLRSSLLHEVLRRRAGLPILLSVVWQEVARRCGIPAEGIGMPGHYVVRVAGDYVDPFAGGSALDVSDVPARHLRPWRGDETLLRILTNISVWAGKSPDRTRVQRWAVELALLLPHHPAELRRDYGALLAATGDFGAAARELEDYAAVVAPVDEAAADRARRQARAARSRLN